MHLQYIFSYFLSVSVLQQYSVVLELMLHITEKKPAFIFCKYKIAPWQTDNNTIGWHFLVAYTHTDTHTHRQSWHTFKLQIIQLRNLTFHFECNRAAFFCCFFVDNDGLHGLQHFLGRCILLGNQMGSHSIYKSLMHKVSKFCSVLLCSKFAKDVATAVVGSSSSSIETF